MERKDPHNIFLPTREEKTLLRASIFTLDFREDEGEAPRTKFR